MNARPIIMQAESVRGTIAGTKTMTRRVVRDAILDGNLFESVGWPCTASPLACFLTRGPCSREPSAGEAHVYWTSGHHGIIRCPYGAPGDRLWVRETLKAMRGVGGLGPISHYVYAADDGRVRRRPDLDPVFSEAMTFAEFFRPDTIVSIHMPRWASRLTLEVVGVRVERLQAITEEDAVAEGCTGGETETPTEQYARLWDSVNGRRPGCRWDESPWVWIVAFRRLP